MSSLARVLFAANNKISRRLLNAGNTLHNPAEINKLYMYRSRNAKKKFGIHVDQSDNY